MTYGNLETYIKSTNVRKLKYPFSLLNKLFLLGQVLYPPAVSNFVRTKFFTPQVKPLTKTQQKWLERANRFSLQVRGRQINYWKIGEGPSLLFVHGWNGRGVQFQRFFEPALDAGFSVLFFDAPAHGDSEGETTNYMEITEVLAHLFKEDQTQDLAGVIAHSLGTSAVINHMSTHKRNVPIVLISAALRLMELLIYNFELHGVPRKTYVKLIREVEEEFQLPMDTQNPVDLIYKIENQTLIIQDTKDTTTPIGPAEIVSSDLEHVSLIKTEDLGHTKILKKQIVVEEALSFILKHQKLSEVQKVAV